MTARELFAAADALLVDVDGTLVDSTAAVTRAWTAFAERVGVDAGEVVRAAQGRPSRETVALFAPEADQAVEAERLERAEQSDSEGTVAMPGAAAVLGEVRPLAVVTSCSRALMEVRLAAAGLAVPAVAITSDEVARGKPDPEPYLRGAHALVMRPERCVALEDAPAGIASARAAGIRVIALRTTHADEELAEADAICDDLSDLLL